ncbi:hypothetical protein EI94DRAFT_1732460 [Lactarius quietus]|nr:hypothetical protein EI94DRAFT_1732460 [Lactarius quietus]
MGRDELKAATAGARVEGIRLEKESHGGGGCARASCYARRRRRQPRAEPSREPRERDIATRARANGEGGRGGGGGKIHSGWPCARLARVARCSATPSSQGAAARRDDEGRASCSAPAHVEGTHTAAQRDKLRESRAYGACDERRRGREPPASCVGMPVRAGHTSQCVCAYERACGRAGRVSERTRDLAAREDRAKGRNAAPAPGLNGDPSVRTARGARGGRAAVSMRRTLGTIRRHWLRGRCPVPIETVTGTRRDRTEKESGHTLTSVTYSGLFSTTT